MESQSAAVLRTDAQGILDWASPSALTMLGWKETQLVGSPVADLLFDHPTTCWDAAGLAAAGGARGPVEVRLRSAEDSFHWCSVRVEPILDPSASVVGYTLVLVDVHFEFTTRRALDALSAGNRIAASAEEEHRLLVDMCNSVVDDSGFSFCWYGRPVDDATQSVQKVASSSDHQEYLDVIEVSWGKGPLGLGPTGTALATGVPVVAGNLDVAEGFRPWVDAAVTHGFRSSIAIPVVVDDAVDGALSVYAAEVDAFNDLAAGVLTELAAQLGYGLRRLRDADRLRKASDDQALLVAAIEHASESVIVTDLTPTILYANPAATESSGYPLEEIVGRNPNMFRSGVQDDSFYAEMWSQLLQGLPWRGLLVNMTKNGELYQEVASITPVRDGNGAVSGYVAVKGNLTRERRLEADLLGQRRRHNSVLGLMQTVRVAATLEATVAAFCEAVMELEDMDAVRLLVSEPNGGIVPLGIVGPHGSEWDVGVPLDINRLDQLLEETRNGAWWFELTSLGGGGGFSPALSAMMLDAGYASAALAPVRWEGQMVGVLVVASRDGSSEEWSGVRLQMLDELGSFAGTLFGAQIAHYAQRERTRVALHDVIEHRKFHPVFQPIVALASGQVIGFEALTRFDDGCRPDIRFADAHAVGLGPELELATAIASVEVARQLDPGVWLSINLSPAAIIEGHAATVIAASDRPITIEITEHAEVENYPAVRRALEMNGPVRISIDDAGAGFASLRHILELQPDVVKLDIGIVRGIDGDPARQALAAGLCHFAALTGTVLIAEGVETEAEAETLRGLSIELVQGYLFGRPEPLPPIG
jgi:PAS domain S-box-containing protein